MGTPGVAPVTSSSDVQRPNANSVPELQETSQRVSSGRTTGSPEQSNTKTQQSHDANFMYKLAPQTGLWNIRSPTILFLQIRS